MQNIYDIIIIGGGPAGLTAAIYARRAAKTALVIEKAEFGGQITYSPRIENYPGISAVSGSELADSMVTQALGFGVEVELDEIMSVRREDGGFVLVGALGEYRARAVIIASGARHRQLGLERENELVGHGVSYCAVCDGDFYSGRNIAVVGGGNSAVGDALMLAAKCESVTVIQDLERLTAEPSSCEKLLALPNVKAIYGAAVTGFVGADELCGLKVRVNGAETELAFDGVFIAVGLEPQNQAFAELVELDEQGYIVAAESTETSCEGIFAAGDCRTKTVRQITTACADGSAAALAACRYLG